MYRIKLSPYHKIFYNEWKLDPKGFKYNLVIDQTFSGNLNITRLRTALFRFVTDHLLFNSHVTEDNNELYWVKNTNISELEYFDVSCYNKDNLYDYATRPFNLENNALYRFGVFANQNQEYRLIIVMHHILMDGISGNKFMTEISQYYNDSSYRIDLDLNGQAEIIASVNAIWDNNLRKYASKYKQFWSNLLSDIEPIDLRFLKPCYYDANINLDDKKDSLIKEVTFNFFETDIAQLINVTRKYGITKYMYSQCIFALLLYYYTNQGKLAISYPVGIKDGKDLICGVRVNTNFSVYNFNEDMMIKDLFGQIKSFIKSLKSAESKYSYYPVYKILENANKGVLNTVFAQTNLKKMQFNFTGTEALKINNEFNIDLSNILTFEQENSGQQLNFRIKYSILDVDEKILLKFIDHYKKLFFEILTDLSNDIDVKLLSQYQILDTQEYNQIVYEWNQTTKDYPKNKTIHQLFEEQVAKTPDSVAIVCDNKVFTYHELNQSANKLAHYISKVCKITPDDLIALCLDVNEYTVICMLAVLKCGAAYIPIDSSYPQDRIKYILEDTQAKIILINDNMLKSITDIVVNQTRSFKVKESINCDIIIIDNLEFQNHLNDQRDTNQNNKIESHNLAYIIYTSGTTGDPKGVMIEHKNVVSLVKDVTYIDLKYTDRFMLLANTAFDAVTFEIWAPLLNGASLFIPTNKLELLSDVKKFDTFLKKNKITILWLTKTLFDQLYIQNNKLFSTIRYLLVGGEPLDKNIITKLSTSSHRPQVLINGYGPTENTTFSAIYNVDEDKNYFNSIPIGKPLTNRKCYILTHYLRPLPVGAIGELYLGGDGVSRGYLNLLELTSKKFITNPFQTDIEKYNNINARLYKTGDLVRYLPDGNIEYIGRNDFQVKIGGYRIELGEVEAILCKHPKIKQAVVIVQDSRGDLNIDQYSRSIDKLGGDIRSEGIDTNGRSSSIVKHQSNLSNVFGLLPIQEWFFAQNFINLNHWNQSFLIRTPKLDKTILLNSLIKLVSYHEVFCLRYKKVQSNQIEKSYVQYSINYLDKIIDESGDSIPGLHKKDSQEQQFYLRELDITKLDYQEGTQEFEDQLYKILTSWQSEFDIENGPLFSFGYIYGYCDGSARIYCALHHLIVDVVSWHIILHDLQQIYTDLCVMPQSGGQNESNNNLKLSNRTYTKYSEWVSIVRLYATNHQHEKKYWNNLLSEHEEFDNHLTALTNNVGINVVKFKLDKTNTKMLVNESRLAFNNKISELLLTPFAIALKEILMQAVTLQTSAVYFTLEGHGREFIDKYADTTRTIGWFTTMFPVKLLVIDDLMSMLETTKRTLDQIPNNGIGYGALFGYTQNLPRVSFNYLGQINYEDHNSLWRITSEPSGQNIDLKNKSKNIIDVVGYVADECITFTVTGYFNNDILNQFITIFRTKLLALVDIICQAHKSHSTINMAANNIQQAATYALPNNEGHRQYSRLNEHSVHMNTEAVFRKYLVAYYVSDSELEQESLKNHLSKYLPQYSVPQTYVHLNSLPLTSGGKVDIKALPGPDTISYYNRYIEPRNEQEDLICQSFSRVLNKKYIGIYDDFFTMGGDSIAVISLVMLLQYYFNVNVSDIYNFRTPYKLAQNISFSNNSIINRLLMIMHEYKHEQLDDKCKLAEHSLQHYRDSVRALHPDISRKEIGNVLLTGATGYLGCNILNQLLHFTNYKIYLLVRADSYKEAVKRINHKYKLYFGDTLNSEITNLRVFVLHADIEKFDFGITEDKYEHLVSNIDSVIHSAALVKQIGNYNIFYTANVQSTINLLEFAKLTKLKDFHYISTASVLKHSNESHTKWGNYYTEESLPEDLELLDNNVYLRTKLEAEMQIVKYRSSGINGNIYRIGNLAFMLNNFAVQENIETVGFTHWLKYLFHSKKIFSGSKVDISPVDLTAEAIVKLFDKRCSTNNIYHVFNPYLFDLVNYMKSRTKLSVEILSIPEFIKYIIRDLEDSTHVNLILRFLLANGWMGIEGIYQFAQKIYLQNKTQYILKYLGFDWVPITNDQFTKYLNAIFKK